jgi:chlorophyllide a reductase subunit X
MGGNVGVAGMVINRDDGTGEAAAFANAVGIPVLATIPANDDIRRKSANYQIVGTATSEWGPLFAGLATNIEGSVPNRPNPLTSDGLLGLFSSKDTGGDIVLEPATVADMCGIAEAEKRSLEVVYEEI